MVVDSSLSSPPLRTRGPAPAHPGTAATTVRLTARVPVLVHAGLDTVLRPYRERVRLLDVDDSARPHVEIFDPESTPARRAAPPARVPRLALTWDLSTANRARAREQGALRVLPLSISVVQLVAAVEEAHRSQPAPVDPVPAPGPGVPLSPREADVMRGICRGLSNVEIAEELYLSVNSVKTYIRTAYRKLGVASRSQAVLWGVVHLTCAPQHPADTTCARCQGGVRR